MEEELTSLLLGDAGLDALVGNRIWWTRAPQLNAVRPYIVLHKIDGVPSYTYQAAANYKASRVQANCYGENFTSALLVSRALTAAVSGHRGGVFQGIFIDSDGRTLTMEDAGGVTNLVALAVDLIIHHTTA